MANPIPVPERLFYLLLLAPVIGMIGVSMIWSGQLSEARQRIRDENLAKQELINSLVEKGVTPRTAHQE